ncbi:uncharacterized protein A4U43_C06F2500 [Asparagus officinalis]|uniref:Secreted protein n=1 Tax=Asparagus officinalis TaxID=4686 RepID=A0A5P1EIZ5_ASPOF|nr:uncharacterized protein A4U43_C06F2500 [Asparagus officinalis]
MPIGFVALPVSIAGLLVLDGKTYYVSMAMTEWCLVASTNSGCKAIGESGQNRHLRLPIVTCALAPAPSLSFDIASLFAVPVRRHVVLFVVPVGRRPFSFDISVVFRRSVSHLTAEISSSISSSARIPHPLTRIPILVVAGQVNKSK